MNNLKVDISVAIPRMKRINYLLLAIIALGFLCRVIGLNFGPYHADEHRIIYHSLAFGTGDLNPHMFYYPTLFMYLLFAVYGVFYAIGFAAGLFNSAYDFGMYFIKNPDFFYILARFVSVAFGTATIPAIYFLGKRNYSKSIGLLSALFISVAFIHARDSHYATTDITMTFFIVLSYIYIIKILQDAKLSNYLLAGLFAGLGMSVKYNAALIVLPIFAAHLLGTRKENQKGSFVKLLSAFAIMIFSFLLTSPYILLDFKNFIKDIIYVINVNKGFDINALFHLKFTLPEAVGWPFFVLSILGFFYAIYKYSKKNILIILFPLLYYFLIWKMGQPFERYVLPLVPFMSIISAWFIVEFSNNVFKRKFIRSFAILLITLVALSVSVLKVTYSDYLMVKKDNRKIAQEWIETHLPEGTKIAIDNTQFSPELKQSKEQLAGKLSDLDTNGQLMDAKAKRLGLLLRAVSEKDKRFNVYYLSETNIEFLMYKPIILHDLNEFKKAGVKYLVTNEIAMNDFSEFYSDLLGTATLLKEFSPYKRKNVQYEACRIYQLTHMPIDRTLFELSRNGVLIRIYEIE